MVSVRCSASSSIQASMSTSPVSCCWTTAATRPAGSRRSRSATCGSRDGTGGHAAPVSRTRRVRAARTPRTSAGRAPNSSRPSPTSGAGREEQRERRRASRGRRAGKSSSERHQPDRPVEGEHDLHGVRADQRAATRCGCARLSARTPPRRSGATDRDELDDGQHGGLGGQRSIRDEAKIAGSSCAARRDRPRRRTTGRARR